MYLVLRTKKKRNLIDLSKLGKETKQKISIHINDDKFMSSLYNQWIDDGLCINRGMYIKTLTKLPSENEYDRLYDIYINKKKKLKIEADFDKIESDILSKIQLQIEKENYKKDFLLKYPDDKHYIEKEKIGKIMGCKIDCYNIPKDIITNDFIIHNYDVIEYNLYETSDKDYYLEILDIINKYDGYYKSTISKKRHSFIVYDGFRSYKQKANFKYYENAIYRFKIKDNKIVNLEIDDDWFRNITSKTFKISDKEISKRRDYRDITTFTIDPFDAKDYDDALSIEFINDIIRVGVHIADVSYFVKRNSWLDNYAYNKGNSTYLVTKVDNMLPEELSNGICSLNENEDRLCMSVIVDFDKKYNIIDKWFGETIIRSNKRFYYEEAQEILNNKEGLYYNELFILNKIAKKIKKNEKRIDINSPDFKINFKDGNIPYLERKIVQDTNYLVEEFMILANKLVAEYLQSKDLSVVYRCHKGIKNGSKKTFITKLNKIKKIKDNDIFLYDVLSSTLLMNLTKAYYTIDNIGHFGLNLENYCHFTSPIRRYSDIIIHRLLKGEYYDDETLKEICEHISSTENESKTLEWREIDNYKKEMILYDNKDVYKGVVTNKMDYGWFIRLEHFYYDILLHISESLYSHTNDEIYNYKIGDYVEVFIDKLDYDKESDNLRASDIF